MDIYQTTGNQLLTLITLVHDPVKSRLSKRMHSQIERDLNIIVEYINVLPFSHKNIHELPTPKVEELHRKLTLVFNKFNLSQYEITH